jgi:hypothetical protein
MNWAHHFQALSSLPTRRRIATARFGAADDAQGSGDPPGLSLATWALAGAGIVTVGGAMFALGQFVERGRHERHYARQLLEGGAQEISGARKRPRAHSEDSDRKLREATLEEALGRAPSRKSLEPPAGLIEPMPTIMLNETRAA